MPRHRSGMAAHWGPTDRLSPDDLSFASPQPAPLPDECLFCQDFPDPWKCCYEIQTSREGDSGGSVFGAFHGTLAQRTTPYGDRSTVRQRNKSYISTMVENVVHCVPHNIWAPWKLLLSVRKSLFSRYGNLARDWSRKRLS